MPDIPQALGEEERELLVAVKAGETIFKERDLGSEMFLIHSGEVEIVRDGGRVALLQEGDNFGEMALLEGLPRSATAKATRDSLLLPIDSGAFDHLIRHVPELPIRIMRKLSGRLRGRTEVPGRVAPAAMTVTAETSRARLVHASGRTFSLRPQGDTTLGRPDSVTGLVPDVDLSALPGGLSASRRHARITVGPGGFSIVEEIGVSNGTTVNGVAVHPGRPAPLADGDEVGIGQVALAFRVEAG